jgi:hypothetical protein
MTDTEKTEKVEALAEEVEGLSAELSDDELEQVAGGGSCDCAASGYGTPTDKGGTCACSALGSGIANSAVGAENPDNLRCSCSGGGFGADGADGGGGGGSSSCGAASSAMDAAKSSGGGGSGGSSGGSSGCGAAGSVGKAVCGALASLF